MLLIQGFIIRKYSDQKKFDLKDYINQWTYKRLIQFAVGVYFMWNFFADGSKLSLLFGSIMLIQAIFNVGCFSTRGCSTPEDGQDAEKPFVKDIKKVKLK